MGQAVTVILLAGVAALVGNIFRAGFRIGIMSLLLSVIGFAIWAFVVMIIGTKVMPEPQTKADLPETFRVIGSRPRRACSTCSRSFHSSAC